MRKKYILVGLLAMFLATGAHAQRVTDKLDRGLVAVKTSGGVFCSWRVNAEEYYDVTYNLYRDGVKVNDKPRRYRQQHLYRATFNKRSGTDGQFQGIFRIA